MTCDTWHVTQDMLGRVNMLSKFQPPSFYRLWFMILWRFGGKGSLTDWLTEIMNDKGNFWIALASPGLLMTFYQHCHFLFASFMAHPNPFVHCKNFLNSFFFDSSIFLPTWYFKMQVSRESIKEVGPTACIYKYFNIFSWCSLLHRYRVWSTVWNWSCFFTQPAAVIA